MFLMSQPCIVFAALAEFCIMMKTRPQKTEEIKERARALSTNMFSGPRQLMRSVSMAPRLAPTLAGLNTSSSSDQLGPMCDVAQLHSLQEALSAEEHDPVEDIGALPASLASRGGIWLPPRISSQTCCIAVLGATVRECIKIAFHCPKDFARNRQAEKIDTH